ncbi:MAG: LemA family protein [Nitrospinae bacterium]|nr:LemA family protein [Nitrospinota bacterium]
MPSTIIEEKNQQKMGEMSHVIKRLYEEDLKPKPKKVKVNKELMSTINRIYFLMSFIIILLIAGIIVSYNTLVTYNEQIKSDFGQIEAELQRRNNLYINMVNLYMSYAELETKIFLDTSRLRNQVGDVEELMTKLKSLEGKVTLEPGKGLAGSVENLGGSLSKLMAVVEQYPQINADQPLSLVVNKLVQTEDRITTARGSYNNSVRTFNNMLNHFPYRYMAWFLGFDRAPYYEATENVRIVPHISSKSPLLSIRER